MKYIVDTYQVRGKTFVEGKGNYLIDQKGDEYLDLMTNIGVNIFGYGNKEISKALGDQISKLPNLHGSFNSPLRVRASIGLVRAGGGKLKSVYWANSGAEAIEAAIKFAVLASGKHNFIAAKGGFHGKTFGALSLTSNSKYRKPFLDLLAKVDFVEYGDIASLAEGIDKKTAAVILEPIQGESGIIIPPENYLKEVEKVCKEKNILFILDEVQSGTGRTGKFLASHWDDVEPDIVCLGKGLALGVSVGATLVGQKVADSITKGIQTSTFGGNPLACAGVVKMLELLDKDRLEKNDKLGKYFVSELKKIKSKNIKEVRGKGLMIGVELVGKVTPVLKRMQEKGIICTSAGENTIRFLPPYTITTDQINRAVDVFKTCVDS